MPMQCSNQTDWDLKNGLVRDVFLVFFDVFLMYKHARTQSYIVCIETNKHQNEIQHIADSESIRKAIAAPMAYATMVAAAAAAAVMVNHNGYYTDNSDRQMKLWLLKIYFICVCA